MPERRPNGPIEDRPSPTEIEARVVTPGPDPRVFGFSVEGDLAVHYRFAELVQTALTGAPPDDAKGRAFDIALQFAAPAAIDEAPTHAAVLSRLIGAKPSSTIAVASIALAERARHVVEQHEDLLAWLDTATGEPPPHCRADDGDDKDRVDRLRKALAAAGVGVPALVHDLKRWPALLATLHFAGLCRSEQIETALVLAGLAISMAEALSHAPSDIDRYPIDVPSFVYEEDP
jgi:hypothetical protein